MAVKFDQRVEINAPPETVWQVVTNYGFWDRWLPGVDSVQGISAVRNGATFQIDGGSGNVTRIDENNALMQLVTQEGSGVPITHTLDIDKDVSWFGMGKTNSALRYVMEYDPPGGFVGEFIVGSNPLDARRVQNALNAIKKLAEEHAGRY